MESALVKIIRWRSCSQILKLHFPVRAYSDLPDLRNHTAVDSNLARLYPKAVTRYWNEPLALKLRRRQKGFPYSLKSATDFIKFIQDFKKFPGNFTELFKFIQDVLNRRDMLNQKFLLERELVLKPDLAAATFLIQRGGAVKFFGQPHWYGFREVKQSLPITYVPGFSVEAIKAEGTGLTYEGLHNLRNLRYLRSLSLKGLEQIDDWCLDYISSQFHTSLKHLDLSYCPNITYRGLSCFYRFENLKTLDLEGVPDSAELKLACLMLLDIMPNLDIKGIDLSIPDKIPAPTDSENEQLLEEVKQIAEEKKLISAETECLEKEKPIMEKIREASRS